MMPEEVKDLVRRFVPEKAADGKDNPAFNDMVTTVSEQLGAFPLSSETDQKTWIQGLEENLPHPGLATALCCEYLYPLLSDYIPDPNEQDKTADTHPDHALPLNGLYRVRIELDDHLNPDNAKHLQRAVRQAFARLSDNRPLCEDFLRPEPVEPWPYCLCLDIETDPAADERAIGAEILYRIQEHLVPSVRFRNFREMRQLGIPCEQIFNGPLLRNGFIAEADLQASQHLPRYIYRSELLRIASEVPGVLDVRDLRFKGPNHTAHSEEWQIPVVGITHQFASATPPYPTDPDAADYPPGHLKPTLDACCSRITVWRNGLRQVLTGTPLDERYQALRIARMGLSTDKPGGPEPPTGILRPDLTEYRSIQYDYPANYQLGDNLPSPQRWASTRQMQAYLLFYDQLLAGYLLQLGQVRDLFSVKQDPAAPTATLPSLFEVPGAQDLMGEFAQLSVPPAAAIAAGEAAERQALQLDQDAQQLQVALSESADEVFKAELRRRIAENRQQAAALRKIEAALQPLTGKSFKKMSLLNAALHEVLGEHYAALGGSFRQAVWQAFVQDPHNNIAQAIAAIA
ncbi:MAG TPA: hypothetical protein PK971_14015, partial [Saprospiraceae bacterium]|nr:hypothetical protein [Saprospiraceae bacterium]